MNESGELSWGPFKLLSRRGPLLRNSQPIKLQSKTLAVLWMLAKQPGMVVTKSELMDAVWPGLVVGDDALTFQIQLLRRALGDDTRETKYIQTVHRVGFCLRVDTDTVTTAEDSNARAFVGRRKETTRLSELLALAKSGERQFVFISGEAGIGKTTFIEHFLADREATASIAVARGQCAEQVGISETFLPFLQAIQQLVRNSSDDGIVRQMQRLAPSWLAQMPGLLDTLEYISLQRQTAGTPEARMLREMIDLLDALSLEKPLLLLIEDLHWSDNATVELLSRLASKREKGRIMVICTLRPADAIVKDHPARRLQLDLRGRGLAHDLLLGHLLNDEVGSYLHHKLGKRLATDPLIAKVLERSNGHPLFMTQILEHLQKFSPQSEEEALALSANIPPGLRDLIELQLLELDASQQQILESGAIAGFEFSAAGVAAATGLAIDVVERNCETLVKQQQFLHEAGLAAWPDGTLSGRYQFRHALHQITLREHMPPARRARYHRLVAERVEAAYGSRSAEVAFELAQHFEAGGLPFKAATYCMMSARTSLQRAAPTEVLSLAHRGLSLLAPLESSNQTQILALHLHTLSANALQARHGYATLEARPHLEQVRNLLPASRDPLQLEYSIALLWISNNMRAEFEEALEHADYAIKLGQEMNLPVLECGGLGRSAHSALHLGRLQLAERQSQKAMKVISGVSSSTTGVTFEAGCVALGASALAKWLMGYPDLAYNRALQSVKCSQNTGNPYTESTMRSTVLINILLHRRDYQSALDLCEVTLSTCEQQGAIGALQWTRIQHGIARCMSEGTEDALTYLRAAIQAMLQTDARLNLLIGYLHIARFCMQRQRLPEARAALDGAFKIIALGMRMFETDAMYLDGELLALEKPDQLSLAEKKIQASMRLASKRGALSLELRSCMSLARFWQAQGKISEAHEILKGVYERFSEGFDTLDLVEARALLDQLRTTSPERTKRKPASAKTKR